MWKAVGMELSDTVGSDNKQYELKLAIFIVRAFKKGAPPPQLFIYKCPCVVVVAAAVMVIVVCMYLCCLFVCLLLM